MRNFHLRVIVRAGRTKRLPLISGRNNSATVATVKKLCDGLGITLGKFFSTPEFDGLEQEIV